MQKGSHSEEDVYKSINCSVKSGVIALSNVARSFFFQNNYPQNIIN